MDYKLIKNNNGIHLVDKNTDEVIAEFYNDDGLADKLVNFEYENIKRQSLILSAILDYSISNLTVSEWCRKNNIKGPPTTKWRNFI